MLLSEYTVLSYLPLPVSLHYLGKHEPRNFVSSVMKITPILLAISSTFIN